MSDTPQNPDQNSDSTRAGRDDDRHIPSADQDVASGQPYDPRKDPGTDPDDESATDESPTDESPTDE